MSFLTTLKNPPEEARYWMPVFYYRDPETGAYTPYYPEDYLDIGEPWLCPLSVGAGIMVDYRCVVYDLDYEIIGTRNLYNIVVRDDEEFVYNWEAEVVPCFIATAAYGTTKTQEIAILRKFRDEVLLPNSLGAQFVSFYYKISPPIAHFISEHDFLRAIVRGLVCPMLWLLGRENDAG